MLPTETVEMVGYAVMLELEAEVTEGGDPWIYWEHAGVIRVPARTQRGTVRTMLLDGQGLESSAVPQLPLASGQTGRVALIPEPELEAAFDVKARTRLVVEVVA